MEFYDRHSAGRALAKEIIGLRFKSPVIVSIPRGGVVVGSEIARLLKAPHHIVLSKKITHPLYSEFAIGAMAENEPAIFNAHDAGLLDDEWIAGAQSTARELIDKRKQLYEHLLDRPINSQSLVVVDDGMATGFTMLAAVKALRKLGPLRIIVAVPVASVESVKMLEEYADVVIVLDDPRNFRGAVGSHYKEFPQISDSTVQKLLKEANYVAT